MKKTVLCVFLLSAMLLSLTLPCSANEPVFHWYCQHAKAHLQPPVAPELAFVREHGGYYVDECHSLPGDRDKVLYLTFDAGYENGNVERVLDVLREEQVTAAFFVLGHLISSKPALVQRMVDEGHAVCNHTMHHKNMAKLDKASFIGELEELEQLFSERYGKPLSPYYRPPEGCFSKANLIWAQEKGYKTVFWSFAYPDWDNAKQMSQEKAKSIVLGNLHNGEVMLLHPTSATNADILSSVIREAKAQGYRFGSLDELTEERNG
jgi:peptidoglycan-N-acetylmuramic acid deacetylase